MYYMITYGATQIEEAYVGLTPEDVIENAKSFLNEWREYKNIETEELIELLLADDCEFDMVQIQSEWQGKDISLEQARVLYKTSLPPHQYAEQLGS